MSQDRTQEVPWQVRLAASRIREDLPYGGKNYGDTRTLLDYVESLIATPQSPVVWLVKRVNADEYEIAEPNEKATNPDHWGDAFPVYKAFTPDTNTSNKEEK